ncbi:glycoside hydrolase family 3 N-terminal domain-containing protein [Halegenticoccus tardaugens]|uniref:glycoside hydrolase family 3 N-terminal domain-containing protein n=1 Tax=Halegenticoccus tardaugens TaxID=2071624 RepID=UPI001E36374C|nr:glycoside hydrolase family 3 N-terminal domain-containing protein [Halegenticoccus tardaugens]
MSGDRPEAPYRDASVPTERRVEDLLDRMTLDEKVAQLTSVSPIPVAGFPGSDGAVIDEDGTVDRPRARELFEHGVGHLTRVGGGGGLDPERAAAVTDELQDVLVSETRLGVPAIPHEECLAGYMGPDGTTYPQAIGLASTWDPDLIKGMTERIREQLLAIGTAHALSPVLDVARDPRWGRTEETFGEDPQLVAEMGSAYVHGLQGEGPEEGVSATVKHFAGHGVGEGGKNRPTVHLGERELRDVHLYPFEVAVREAGVESVMNAYHDIDGVPCAADRDLLTGVLRGEWGFDGTVVSDYFSVVHLVTEHGVAETPREAAVRALAAGIDVELPAVDCYDRLIDAINAGDLSEATVDTAVRRVLRQKFRKGLFESRGVDPDAAAAAFGPDANREYARKLARESVTVLKNDGLLPLSEPSSVAVVGPKADAPVGQLGDYTYPAHYPDEETTRRVVTSLEAFEARLGDDAVAYSEGCTTTGSATDGFDEAAAAAADSDVAVAFVGARSALALSDAVESRAERPDLPTSGEGADVTDLSLPGVQNDLLEELHGTGTPLAVVVVSGKPHTLTWADEHVPAVVHAWLPGEEGGHGIADVLFGDHDPGGRLPISIPKSVGQLPVYYSRRPNSRNERHVYTDSDPLYPFGHGCSYAEFAYEDLELSDREIGPAGTITAAITVENTGERAGYEVVQLYVSEREPSLVRPVQELKGFRRVHLDAGEVVRVSFDLSASMLASHDLDMTLAVEPGPFEVRIGRSAAAVEATETFDVVGDRYEVPRGGREYATETSVERVDAGSV